MGKPYREYTPEDIYNMRFEITTLTKQLDQLKKANDEKNELLAKLGCPTIATARMKAFTLEQQLEAYKMEAEEGKEINAELKAENAELKYKAEFFENYNNAHINKITKLEKILTEIKEIAENAYCLTNATNKDMAQFAKQVLQKISECEVEDV